MTKYSLITALIGCLLIFDSFSQNFTIINGVVKDYVSSETIPFVNIYFKGTTLGTTSNIDGTFYLKTKEKYDTIVVSFVGYKTIFLAVKLRETQTLNIELEEDNKILDIIEIHYDRKNKYKNPAWDVMRGFLHHRKNNDKYKLKAYEFDNYTQTQIYGAQFSKGLLKTKFISKMLEVTQFFDSLKDDSGKPLLPLFYSESASKVYYRNNPSRLYEKINKTNFKGIFIQEQGGISTFLGNTYQEYNFYKNTVSIFQKEFISPLSANWRLYYNYVLESDADTLEGIPCYRLRYFSKESQNLTFKGKIWISKKEFALKRIEAETEKKINVNFIEKVAIKINFKPIPFNLQSQKYGWLPQTSTVEVYVGEILEKFGKLWIKYNVINDKFIINNPYPVNFYKSAIDVADDAGEKDKDFWKKKHNSIKDTIIHNGIGNLIEIIDSLENTKVVKRREPHVLAINTGYYSVGKIDLGPYPYIYAYNNIEGHRFFLGGKTSGKLTNKFTFSGYVAYGTGDKTLKYNANIRYIPSVKPWLVLNVSHQKDIEQISLYIDRFNTGVLFNGFDNTGFNPTPFFYASNRFGTLKRPFKQEITQFWTQLAVARNFFQTVAIRHRQLTPLFPFEYPNNEGIQNKVNVTELVLESRLSFKENWVFNKVQNAYSSLGTRKPIFLLRYTTTLNTLLNNNASYRKIDFTFRHSTLTNMGRLTYQFNLGYYFDPVPYLLIESHLGNPSYIFNASSFNLLNIFEYSSDRYVTLLFRNNFDGLLLNTIPLFKRLKWRSLIGVRAIYGTISQATKDLVLTQTQNGEPIPPVLGLDKIPYIEAHFAIHNIFKLLRVDFISRLTYRDTNSSNFMIKGSIQLSL